VARGFERLGYAWRHKKNELLFKADASAGVKLDLARTIPKIEDGIWPAFPSDLMSVMIVLATQVPGSVLFYEKLFESRMYFVDSLISMGAKIVQCDPHRVLVVGPSELYAGHMNSPDIRAGMALIVAALCAKGESIIDNAEVIDRGYERIEERLQALGADIERVD
jgi:UDP-N-acetylglucosamine 1-carboxyvinyltransferase